VFILGCGVPTAQNTCIPALFIYRFFGNLPYSITKQVLQDAFGQCGTIDSVNLITDRDTDKAKVLLLSPETCASANITPQSRPNISF